MGQDSFDIDYNGSLIGEDMEIMGNFKSERDVYLKGKIVGDVRCDSRLIVNAGAVINGDVHCRELFLDGLITGDVWADHRVELKPGAVIKGYVTTSLLHIHPDATIEKGLKLSNLG